MSKASKIDDVVVKNIVDNGVQFDGLIYKSKQFEIEYSDGTKAIRNMIDKKPCVVCLVRRGRDMVLTNEYRIGTDSVEKGLVAGIVEDGEMPLTAALRELEEETGFSQSTDVKSVVFLGDGYSSSGFTNEHVYYFYIILNEYAKQKEQALDRDERMYISFDSWDFINSIIRHEMKSEHAKSCYLHYLMYNDMIKR